MENTITQSTTGSAIRSGAFIALHFLCFAAIFTGVHLQDPLLCFALYFIRMFGVTAGYHRYFSHRSFKTSRVFQFLLGWLAMTSGQKGCLWWAAHHRHHHKHSDQEDDVHSPRQQGFYWSHVGWIMSDKWMDTNFNKIKDLTKYPELVWLNKMQSLPITLLGIAVWWFFGWSGLVVGFIWSTVLLWHGTFTINSLAHVIGSVRYKTKDDSKNHWLLALITLGEGWHNNHHYYQSSARQGFFWWEIDISYYIIKMLSFVGIVWDVREPPQHVVAKTIASEQTAQESAPNLLTNPLPVAKQHLTNVSEDMIRQAKQATTNKTTHSTT